MRPRGHVPDPRAGADRIEGSRCVAWCVAKVAGWKGA